MRKKSWCYAVLLIGFLIFSHNAYALPVVSIEPVNPISANNPFDLRVLVDGVPADDGILAFGFNTSAPASWTFNSTTIGPLFFDDTGIPGVEYAGSTLDPVSGDDILLATLNYTAPAGMYAYSISGNIAQNNQGLFFELTWQPIDASTNVCVIPCIIINDEPKAVPEPATLMLLGFGLLVLSFAGMGLRRRTQGTVK